MNGSEDVSRRQRSNTGGAAIGAGIMPHRVGATSREGKNGVSLTREKRLSSFQVARLASTFEASLIDRFKKSSRRAYTRLYAL